MTVIELTSRQQFLLGKVRSGNDKFIDAWNHGIETPGNEEVIKQLNRISNSYRYLSNLVIELESTGYNRCLYDEPKCKNDPQYFCFVCPRETTKW